MNETKSTSGTLVLYSDQIAGTSDAVDERLVELLAKTPGRVAFIPSTTDPKRCYVSEAEGHYATLGLRVGLLFDVGSEYDGSLLPRLAECDAIHLAGGDAGAFLAAARERGLGAFLRRYLESGKVVVGVSAGAMILGPTLGICDAFHEDGALRPARERAAIEKARGTSRGGPKALGLVPFETFPHYDGSEATNAALLAYARERKVEVYGLHDSEGLIVTPRGVESVGEVVRFP